MKGNRTKLLEYSLTAVVLFGVGWAAAQYLNGNSLLDALHEFNYWLVLPMLVLSAASLLVKGWRFVVLARPVTQARWGLLLRLYVAGRPATLLPGGVAVRAGFLKQAGVDAGKGASPVVFDSLMDQVFLIPAAILTALWFPQARLPVAIMGGLVGGLVIVLFVPALRRRTTQVVDAIAGKFNITRSWRQFLDSSQDLLAPRTFAYTFALTVISYALMVAVLVLALHGLGLGVAYHKTFMAVILANLVGRMVPTPGGVGVTEASLVGFLTLSAGVNGSTAAAAAGLYRVATLLWQAFFGAVVYLFAWRGMGENAEPAGEEQLDEAANPAKATIANRV